MHFCTQQSLHESILHILSHHHKQVFQTHGVILFSIRHRNMQHKQISNTNWVWFLYAMKYVESLSKYGCTLFYKDLFDFGWNFNKLFNWFGKLSRWFISIFIDKGYGRIYLIFNSTTWLKVSLPHQILFIITAFSKYIN